MQVAHRSLFRVFQHHCYVLVSSSKLFRYHRLSQKRLLATESKMCHGWIATYLKFCGIYVRLTVADFFSDDVVQWLVENKKFTRWVLHSCFNRSHLSRGLVRQSAHLYPSHRTVDSLLFLLYAADPEVEVVFEHRPSQGMRWLLVVMTTATACCTRWTLSLRKLCSQFYTQLLNSSCVNGSLTASLRHLETTFTGCQYHRGLFTACAVCTIIYKCLHQTAPKYLQELCVPVTTTASRRHLRSAVRRDLQVLATRTVTFWTSSFAASAPKLWISLPPALQDSTQFCSWLKTHLFCLAYGCALWLLRL